MAAFMKAMSGASKGKNREGGRRRSSAFSIWDGVVPVPDEQEQTAGVDPRLVDELLAQLSQLIAGQERLEGKIDVVQKEVGSLGAMSAGQPLMQVAPSELASRSSSLQVGVHGGPTQEEGAESSQLVGFKGSLDPRRVRPASRCAPGGAPARRAADVAEGSHPWSSLQIRMELLKHSGSQADEAGAKLRRRGTRAAGGPGGTAFFGETPSGASPQALVMHPESPKRVVFDLLAMVVLQFDLLLVPYALAWDVRFEGPLLVVAWIVAGFWLLDLVLGLFTGFYRNGELEMRRKQIRRHYVRTTFLLNALPLVCDVASLSLALGGLEGSAGVLRMLDLVRVHRLWSISTGLVQRSLSDKWSMVMQGAQLVYAVVWMNHMLSCAWYAIALWTPSDTGERWFDSLQTPGAEEGQFQKTNAVYQYFTAFHFSIAQLFAGGLEGVSPLSTLERLFNIFTLLFGMLFVSSLVGALSTTMMQIKLRNEESAGRLRELRQFLSEQSISAETAVRVQKQVAERMSKKKRLTDKDVFALSLLSNSLRWTLRSEIFGPEMVGYPLFRLCQSIAPDLLSRMCGEAVDTKEMSLGDVLFEAGTFANSMFLLTAGTLKYKYTPPEKHDPDPEELEVEEVEEEQEVMETVSSNFSPQWLCEIALWTQWTHFGTALAFDACELLVINAAKTLSIALRHALIKDIFIEYGREFHKRAVSATNANERTTDIHVPSASYDELVFTMNHETRRMIGHVVVAEVKARGHVDMRKVARLVEEVDDGRSCVVMNGDGEVERAVAVTVLQLNDTAGNVLVQIAKTVEDTFAPVCQLPGVKQKGSESPSEAIQRLLTDLSPLVPAVQIKRSDLHRQVDLKDSPTYGTPTKYLRTTYTASLEQPFVPGAALQPYAPVEAGDPPSGGEGQGGSSRPSVPNIAVYRMQEGLCANNVYAWMPPDDLKFYSSMVGRSALNKWIASLGSPCAAPPSRRGSTRAASKSTAHSGRAPSPPILAAAGPQHAAPPPRGQGSAKALRGRAASVELSACPSTASGNVVDFASGWTPTDTPGSPTEPAAEGVAVVALRPPEEAPPLPPPPGAVEEQRPPGVPRLQEEPPPRLGPRPSAESIR
ncbi:unnamed protein product [Prorocentrum cordatum]|uniref:Cyclic nucleotide-binding domain-containing protein n=1 Tax=Prorocentrum cordatum TaxID=2364126 RepID=A0ABN9RIJ3_9DINO|nr:unnamed protein product [Polarella glacialis]